MTRTGFIGYSGTCCKLLSLTSPTDSRRWRWFRPFDVIMVWTESLDFLTLLRWNASDLVRAVVTQGNDQKVVSSDHMIATEPQVYYCVRKAANGQFVLGLGSGSLLWREARVRWINEVFPVLPLSTGLFYISAPLTYIPRNISYSNNTVWWTDLIFEHVICLTRWSVRLRSVKTLRHQWRCYEVWSLCWKEGWLGER